MHFLCPITLCNGINRFDKNAHIVTNVYKHMGLAAYWKYTQQHPSEITIQMCMTNSFYSTEHWQQFPASSCGYQDLHQLCTWEFWDFVPSLAADVLDFTQVG